MSASGSVLRRLSIRLARHASRVLPESRSVWARAMQNELAHIESDIEAVRWAIGCALAGYAERIDAADLPLPRGVRDMKHHMISLATVVAALICLLSGFNDGAFALIVISLALESTFWFRVHSRSRPATLEAASLNVTLDVAFSCYSLLIVMFIFWGGWLWFAGSVVATNGTDLMASYLPVMLKMSGGGMVMFASAVMVLLLVPFRQGAVWARWAIPALLFVQFGVLYAVRSGAIWPMPISELAAKLAAGAAITMVALAVSLVTTRKLAPA